MQRYIPLFALAISALCVGEALGQTQVGIRGGYDLDMEDAVLGAEARFRVGGPALPILIAPAFDYYFIDSDAVSFSALDLNVLFPFGITNRAFTPYAGAGLGIGFSSVEVGNESESDTDFGVNLVGGAVFGFGRIQPFIQARLKFGGDADLATLHGGLLFAL